MQSNAEVLLSKNIPYNIDTLFTQICYYKVFEVNLLRTLFGTDKSLTKIKLINSYWFDKWKKVSCYEAIKHELNMNCTIQDNFKCNINNYYKIVESINNEDQLDNNIENDYIISEYDKAMNRINVDHETEFEIISNDLWESFLQQNNTNRVNIGTPVELDLENLTHDSLIIHLNSKASYIIFWNREKQCLGKLIFVFSDNAERDCVIQGIKHSYESFIIFYVSFLGDLVDTKDINYSDCSFKCINKTDKKILNYDDFKNYKRPVGLVNVRLTCYMNAALQSLFYVPALTNYLLKETNAIKNMNGYHSFLNEYLNVVLNLSKKAEGSKLKEAYSPKEFFKIIENENEFQDLAGDSIDMVRFTLEKLHSELSCLPNDEITFSKYLGNNNNTLIVFGQQMLKLNAFINNYSANNKSIISNTFYFIEKTVMTCCNCKKTVSIDFNCQMYIIFPLKDIKNQILFNNFKKTPLYQKLTSNNDNLNPGIQNNNFIFNNSGMPQNNNYNFNNPKTYPNNNCNFNNQNNFNSPGMYQNNNNCNFNNQNNFNNPGMNQNNNNCNFNNQNNFNNSGMNQNNNNCNFNNQNNFNNPGIYQNNNNCNFNNQNNFNNPGMYQNNNCNFNNQNNFNNPGMYQNNCNFNNPMFQMFQKNMIFKNEYEKYSNMNRNLTIKLMDCFEYNRNKVEIINEITCQSCNMPVKVSSKTIYYTLPDVLIINLSRDKDNLNDVSISFDETIDLTKEAESKIDRNIYDLICIVTHFGKSGTEGHYKAYCKKQDNNKWYQFNDNIVTESNFQEASSSGTAYILFYQRKQDL